MVPLWNSWENFLLEIILSNRTMDLKRVWHWSSLSCNHSGVFMRASRMCDPKLYCAISAARGRQVAGIFTSASHMLFTAYNECMQRSKGPSRNTVSNVQSMALQCKSSARSIRVLVKCPPLRERPHIRKRRSLFWCQRSSQDVPERREHTAASWIARTALCNPPPSLPSIIPVSAARNVQTTCYPLSQQAQSKERSLLPSLSHFVKPLPNTAFFCPPSISLYVQNYTSCQHGSIHPQLVWVNSQLSCSCHKLELPLV